jgi:hypothetical protein
MTYLLHDKRVRRVQRLYRLIVEFEVQLICSNGDISGGNWAFYISSNTLECYHHLVAYITTISLFP